MRNDTGRAATARREKFPGREPIDVSKTVWLYEDRKRVTVVAESRSEAGYYQGTVQANIPMRFLCRIVDRYRRAKRKL